MDKAVGGSLLRIPILGCFLVVFLFKYSHTQELATNFQSRNSLGTSLRSANQPSRARITLTRQIFPIQQAQDLTRNNFLQRWASGGSSSENVKTVQDRSGQTLSTFQSVPRQDSINVTSAGERMALNSSHIFSVPFHDTPVNASQSSRIKRQADTRSMQFVGTLRRNPFLASSQQLATQGMGINSQLQNSQIIPAPQIHVQHQQQQFRTNLIPVTSDQQWAISHDISNPTRVQRNQATQFSQQVIQPASSTRFQQQQAIQQWSPTRFQQQQVPLLVQQAIQRGAVFPSVFPGLGANPGLAMSLSPTSFAGGFPFMTSAMSPDMWQEMMFGDTTDPPDTTPPPEPNTAKSAAKKQPVDSPLPELPSTTVAPANVTAAPEKKHFIQKLNSKTESAQKTASKTSKGSQQKIDDLLISLLAELQNTKTLLDGKTKQQPIVPASTHEVQSIPSSKTLVSAVNSSPAPKEHVVQGANASVSKEHVAQGTNASVPKDHVAQKRKGHAVSSKTVEHAHSEKAHSVHIRATAQRPQPVTIEPDPTNSQTLAQNVTSSNPSGISVTSSNPSLISVLQELLAFFKKKRVNFTTSEPITLSTTTSVPIITEEV